MQQSIFRGASDSSGTSKLAGRKRQTPQAIGHRMRIQSSDFRFWSLIGPEFENLGDLKTPSYLAIFAAKRLVEANPTKNSDPAGDSDS